MCCIRVVTSVNWGFDGLKYPIYWVHVRVASTTSFSNPKLTPQLPVFKYNTVISKINSCALLVNCRRRNNVMIIACICAEGY